MVNNDEVKDKIVCFLNAFNLVAEHSVDLINNYNGDVSSEMYKAFDITIKDYLNSIYHKRSYEDELMSTLNFGSHIAALVGEKGSGKTSIIHSIKKDLLAEDDTLVIHWDVRSHGFPGRKSLSDIGGDEFETKILEAVKNLYFEKIFYSSDSLDGENPYYRLFSYFLDTSIPHPPGFPLGHKAVPILRKYRRWKKDFPNRGEYYEFLLDHDGIAVELDNIYDEYFKPSYLMIAARYLKKYRQQYIFFDNLETLSMQQMGSFQGVISRMFLNVSSIARPIFSLREESVFREGEYPFNEVGAPMYLTTTDITQTYKVKLYAFSESSDIEVNAFTLTKLQRKTVKAIVNKRIQFTRDRMNEIIKSNYTVNPRIKGYEKYISKTEIDENTFAVIIDVSNRILKELSTLKAAQLANNSVRTLLLNYSAFLKYIFVNYLFVNNDNLNEDSNITLTTIKEVARKLSGRRIRTMFLLWLHDVKSVKDNSCTFNLLRTTKQGNRSRELTKKLSLEYLVLSLINNLTYRGLGQNNNLHHYDYPTVKKVVKKLKKLGYKQNAILRCILRISATDRLFANYVSLQQFAPVDVGGSIKNINHPKDRLSITARGSAYLKYATPTYGLLLTWIKNVDYKHDNIIDTLNADIDVLPYIAEMAKATINTLVFIKNKNIAPYDGADWYNDFLTHFGVVYQNTREEGLIIQTLITGIMAYFQGEDAYLHKDVIDGLSEIKNHTNKLISTIRNNKTLDVLWEQVFDKYIIS